MPTLRSLLPSIHGRRVCVPWFYALGYGVYVVIAIWLAKEFFTMHLDLEVATMWALVICAIFGSVAYWFLVSTSAFKRQKVQAQELRDKIAGSGRDPTNPDAMTPAERWEIAKVAKFDPIFIYAAVFGAIIGAGLAIAVVYMFGGAALPDAWQYYGLVGFFAGMICALVANRALISIAVSGKWNDKEAEFLQGLREATNPDDVVAALTANGLDPAKAKALATELTKTKKI